MGALTLSSHACKEILNACSAPCTFLNPRLSYPEIQDESRYCHISALVANLLEKETGPLGSLFTLRLSRFGFSRVEVRLEYYTYVSSTLRFM